MIVILNKKGGQIDRTLITTIEDEKTRNCILNLQSRNDRARYNIFSLAYL